MSGNGSDMEHHARVYQAQGIVSVQAKCSKSEALALMQNTADATEETLEVVATEVLNGTARFD